MKELKNKENWQTDMSRNSRHLADGEEVTKDVSKSLPTDHGGFFKENK